MYLLRSIAVAVALIVIVGCSGLIKRDSALLDSSGIKMDFTRLDAPVPIEMKVSYEGDANIADFEAIKKSIERFSELLWRNTYGNMYIKKAIVSDKSNDGYAHLTELEYGGHAYFDGQFVVSLKLYRIGNPDVGIRVAAAGFLHEFAHSMLHLKDEYGTTSTCVMRPQSRISTFCKNCEDNIRKRFKKWQIPESANPEEWLKKNPSPATEVIVIDN